MKINFVFQLFDCSFWFEKEWEFDVSIFNIGTHGHTRSLFSYSGGMNYKSTLDFLFIHIL